MIMNYQTLTTTQIFEEAEAIAGDARTLFGNLNEQQLNWKPDSSSWSVAQCLDHLVTINREYFPIFDRILKGEYRKAMLHRLPILPGILGRLMVKALSPDSYQKFKAPDTARPSSSSIDSRIVDRFTACQRETVEIMRRLADFDPAKIIITSPFASVVVYSLQDAFRLIVAHERRHFAQAQRVMTVDGFPK
jgi:DinB superfamily